MPEKVNFRSHLVTQFKCMSIIWQKERSISIRSLTPFTERTIPYNLYVRLYRQLDFMVNGSWTLWKISREMTSIWNYKFLTMTILRKWQMLGFLPVQKINISSIWYFLAKIAMGVHFWVKNQQELVVNAKIFNVCIETFEQFFVNRI